MQGFSGNPRTVLRWLQAQGLFPRRYELRRAQDNWDQQKEKEAQFAEEVCSSCGISELETFALGLQKELPAFQAACALPSFNSA